ncbi:MAG: hypothetical protein ACLSHO_09200 [Dysosmobacter sp.]
MYLPRTGQSWRMPCGRSAASAHRGAGGGADLRPGADGRRTGRAVSAASGDLPQRGEFDYEAKYQAGGAKEICPAELTEEQAKAVGEMALRVHKALGLAVYSRTDMIMDENGQLWCLEANSLPGMTPTSFVPKEAAAVGISYDDLCEEIVRQSLKIKRR